METHCLTGGRESPSIQAGLGSSRPNMDCLIRIQFPVRRFFREISAADQGWSWRTCEFQRRFRSARPVRVRSRVLAAGEADLLVPSALEAQTEAPYGRGMSTTLQFRWPHEIYLTTITLARSSVISPRLFSAGRTSLSEHPCSAAPDCQSLQTTADWNCR